MAKRLNCILLIDDNEDDNFFHEIILRETDVANNIQVAENGQQALQILQQQSTMPELIFLDINMPRMNGWEFLEKYKLLDATQKAKTIIVMLTTSLNPADKDKAATIPEIAAFEHKPLTEEMVTKFIQQFFSE